MSNYFAWQSEGSNLHYKYFDNETVQYLSLLLDLSLIHISGESWGSMTACYATGNVTLEIYPGKDISGGGVVGFKGGNSVLACYATGNVNSKGSSCLLYTSPSRQPPPAPVPPWMAIGRVCRAWQS